MSTGPWTLPLLPCGEDLCITLPPDLLSELGWKEGDRLIWTITEPGVASLRRADPAEEDAPTGLPSPAQEP